MLFLGILSFSGLARAMYNGEAPRNGGVCGHGASDESAAWDLAYRIYLLHDIRSQVSRDENFQVQLDFFNGDGDYVKSARPRLRESWDGFTGQTVQMACLSVN